MYILCSGQKLDLWKALKLQDLQHLSYVFVPLNLIDAWRFLHGFPGLALGGNMISISSYINVPEIDVFHAKSKNTSPLKLRLDFWWL